MSFLGQYDSPAEFIQTALKSVSQVVRSSNELPSAGKDYDYYHSFEAFRQAMNSNSTELLNIMQGVLKHQGIKSRLWETDGAAELEDKIDHLVDSNDQILERVGLSLDELQGLRKKDDLEILKQPPPQTLSVVSTVKKNRDFKLLAGKNVQRPQLNFKTKVDNSHSPFVPKLKEKHNALKPFQAPTVEDVAEGIIFTNPYEYEIKQWSPPDPFMLKVKPKAPKPLKPIMIINVKDLQDLVDLLETEDEIAVDLEHHSYRTFLGITCLVQISTRDNDYIIDTLKLWDDMHILNQVFSNPEILKVFHGSTYDIHWLQRDFGIYVVGLFDTYVASWVLQHSGHSLQFLLEHYCNFSPEKKYQMADWRIRPLPDELISYAQSDTHYLLYVWDCMKNELIALDDGSTKCLSKVFADSKLLCLANYEKPIHTDTSSTKLYMKNRKLFDKRQLAALKLLYDWRDKIARQEDESIGYVLPNHMMMQIAQILPRETQGILACCNPIPPLVKAHCGELHQMILTARTIQPDKSAVETVDLTQQATDNTEDFEWLHPVHDTVSEAFSNISMADFPLDRRLLARRHSSVFQAMQKSKFSVADSVFELFTSSRYPQVSKANVISQSFSSPFRMFLPTNQKRKQGIPVASSEEAVSQTLQSLPGAGAWILKPHGRPAPTRKETELARKAKIRDDVSRNLEDLRSEYDQSAVPLRQQQREANERKRKSPHNDVKPTVIELDGDSTDDNNAMNPKKEKLIHPSDLQFQSPGDDGVVDNVVGEPADDDTLVEGRNVEERTADAFDYEAKAAELFNKDMRKKHGQQDNSSGRKRGFRGGRGRGRARRNRGPFRFFKDTGNKSATFKR